MTILFYLLVIVFFLGGVVWLLLSTPPKKLASIVQIGIPLVLLITGAVLIFFGRVAFGVPTLGLAYGFYRQWRPASKLSSTGQRKSRVRSAMFEMELDLDSGEMDGEVLAGHFEGCKLSALSQDELITLYDEVSDDHESTSLLEAYLDRRFTAWRESTNSQRAGRTGSPSASGPMTKQEAYQILGLEPGASTAEVRKAWRKLIKSVHPDSGGTEFLAAKINEAKDVLLS